MKLFKLEIYTPNRKFFSGEVEHLVINTPTGEMGIMFNTLPSVTLLKCGIIKILQSNKWMEAANSDGFVRIGEDSVSIFADDCVWPYEVTEGDDSEKADILSKQAKKEQSIREHKLAKANLAKQFAKLKIKDRDEI